MVNADANSTDSSPKLNLINIRDEVYKHLRTEILNHDYPAGYRFDLSLLENQLGVSRTPLKEALHRLEVEGLVEIRPRRGTYVVDIDPADVAESFEVRHILECAAAELGVVKATDTEVQEIRAVAEAMKALLRSNDYQIIIGQYIELDRRLHTMLVDLAQNSRLTRIYLQVDTHLQVARVRQKFSVSDSKRYTEVEHEAILVALEQRDREALVAALTNHTQLSKQRILKVI